MQLRTILWERGKRCDAEGTTARLSLVSSVNKVRVSAHDDIKMKLGTLYSLCASCHVVFRP